MRGCTPCKETLETVLEDKDYSNSVAVSAPWTRYLDRGRLPGIESAKVVSHQRKRKAGPVDVF